MSQHVYVGMSGGVDSSVTAALLKQQGYQVTGVYMKNWTTDLPGMKCPWADDLADAKRVAVQLGIPFKVFDFQKEYRHQVVDHMISEYQAGRTPNPDIMCNQEIKFNLFLKTALADGADLVATGHYARVASELSQNSEATGGTKEGTPNPRAALASTDFGRSLGDRTRGVATEESLGQNPWGGSSEKAQLLKARDENKDQTYFLYRVTKEALARTLMPLGQLTKPQVRAKAQQLGLATANKKDSQGICFVGTVGIKEFLQQYITTQPGPIIDKKTQKTIGQHDGAIYYTLGQRHGLNVGGGLPYYVVGKDMNKNIIYVTTDLNDETLWRTELQLNHLHWINDAPKKGQTYHARLRHRGQLIKCHIASINGDTLTLQLADPERAITPGQSTVLYDGDRVVGGGIVTQ